MENFFQLRVAIPLFCVVGILSLFVLTHLRLWANGFQFKKAIVGTLTYIIYCISTIVLLTGTVVEYQDSLSHQPAAFLGLIAFLFLAIPVFCHILLMLADPRLARKQKTEKLEKYFNTTDSILLFVLAQPSIYVAVALRNGTPDFVSKSVTGSLAFIIGVTGIIIYKHYLAGKALNQKRMWWIILAEWTLLIGSYLPLIFSGR